MFIPIVFREAGASETLVCSRAKRAQSELEALIAPRRVEGSQRNFLDSLPTPYSVNHLTEKTRLCSRKNKTKENEPNVIDRGGVGQRGTPFISHTYLNARLRVCFLARLRNERVRATASHHGE